MKRKKAKPTAISYEPQRRLSPWRVLLAIIILGGIVTGSIAAKGHWQAARPVGSYRPWFAAYVDVTSTPTFAFDQMGSTSNRDAILSFIVSSSSDACTPSWGKAYTLDQAGNALDLDRRIARLEQQGGSIAVSFGGLDNDELAIKCTDPEDLQAAYRDVIERYDIDTIDLDIEDPGLSNTAAGARRATAIAQLQSQRRSHGKKLAVWVTLPVTPQGLQENGTDAVAQLLAKGVDLAGVNAMTMDYGSSLAGQTMEAASESALTETVRQLGILYQQAGIHLNNTTLWSKVGATPMIGQNDNAKEIFTLTDAEKFNKFTQAHGVERISMWSANRDIACGSNYVDIKVVSDSCSGVKQAKHDFAVTLSSGFKGSLSRSAGIVTTSDKASTVQKPDNPTESPYQIWSESAAYLEGTKVVWHHNVYQAKWWTQGETPDNPVLQSWQTPWELVGPVLPGEKPIPQLSVPAGTYPEWSGKSIYNTDQRVLFGGIPYQAKWWNQGQSPAAASSNPNGSPWAPLTQAQINDLLQ